MSEVIKSSLLMVMWYLLLTPLRIVRNVAIGVGVILLGIAIFAVSATVAITVAMTMLELGGGTENWMWVWFCAMVGITSYVGTSKALTEGGKLVRKTSRGTGIKKGVKV